MFRALMRTAKANLMVMRLPLRAVRTLLAIDLE
jgi:hypothetical protein